MKSIKFLSRKVVRRLHGLAALLLLLFTVVACTGTPGVQVSGSGWYARRWVNDTAYASTNSSMPEDVYPLGNTEQEVNDDGYVTTDANGQARVRKGSWTCYIFQNGSGATAQEYFQGCARGPSCTITCSGSGLSVVTLPANITINSTVTIVVFQELGAVVVLTSEGSAEVMPRGGGMPSFVVTGEDGGNGAYAVLPENLDKAINFFGFGPGEMRKFPDFIVPIQNMGQYQQLQSANLVLLENNLPIVPLPEPYSLILRWVGDEYDARIANAILRTANLQPLFDKELMGIPVFFSVKEEKIDARAVDFNPDLGKQLFMEAGFPQAQPMILAYEERIPGALALAQQIAADLAESGWINFTLQPVYLLENPNILDELRKGGTPVLHLGAD